MRLKSRVALVHWRIVAYAAFCIVAAVLLTSSSKDIGLRVFDLMAQRQNKNLTAYLAKDEAYTKNEVSRFSQDPALQESVKNRDIPALTSLLNKEKEKTRLSVYTVTDANGVALLRTPASANLGDNIFLTNPMGRAVSTGKEVTSYVPIRDFPLAMASGVLFKDKDGTTPLGAIFGGYWLDNIYARSFKAKYLNDYRHREIIFYSKDEGVAGDSIEDLNTRNKIRAYLSHASTIIQDGRSGDLLNIDGTDYVVTNHTFAGPDEIYGGALLLTPIPFTLLVRSMLLALFISILFFISLLIIERISLHQFFQFKKKALEVMLLILSGMVFVSIWTSVYAYGLASTTHLDKPKFVIYNSTMNIRPDSGVYAIGYQQQAAIVIHSGGEEINAVEVNLRFDPKAIDVDSISFDRSICSPESIIDQTINNEDGTVSISCVVLEKAFADVRGVVADINFIPKKSGDVALTFDENTHVYAADGLGTDVLRSTVSGFYRAFDEKDLFNIFSKKAIVIPYSPTHQNSSKWYNSKRIALVWPKVPGAEYVYEFSSDATTTILDPHTTSATALALQAPSDGVFYFKIAPKKGSVFGQVSIFKIQIDTMAPDTPTIMASDVSIKKNDIVRFMLSSNDASSGLQKNYYVEVDGSAWLPTSSQIYMPFYESGKHTFGVRVFDNAENFSDAYMTINVRN